jgi:hypothetical protein
LIKNTFVMRRSAVRLRSVAQEQTIRFIDKKANKLLYINLFYC